MKNERRGFMAQTITRPLLFDRVGDDDDEDEDESKKKIKPVNAF